MFAPLLKSETHPCIHFGSCSGCSLNERTPPVFEEARNFFETKLIAPFRLYFGAACGWRCRAKLAVRGSVDKPLIGLFREGSHQVVDIPYCQVHHPRINSALDIIRTFISQEKIIPYEERTGTGDLRYLQCVVEQMTGRIQLTLVFNHDFTHVQKWEKSFQKLWEKQPDLWHSVWLNFNTRRDNIIFGNYWHLWKGEPFLWETFGGCQTCYHPASFAQANFEMFEKMVSKIKQKIHDQAKVMEFYAGVGAIGLALSDKSRWVRCCEINPIAKHCFEVAVQRLPLELSSKVSFYSIAASEGIHLMNEADTVIVDPPRRGLDSRLITALQRVKEAKQLIYISCNWNTFYKDCQALYEGGWELKEAEAYLFFPGSNHIELLTIFERKGYREKRKSKRASKNSWGRSTHSGRPLATRI